MWLRHEELGPSAFRFACSLGRALALAQSFEENCKYVLLIADLGEEAKAGRVKNLEDMQSYSEKLTAWFKLGGAVNRFEVKHKIKPKEVELLRKGKDARNYIAHRAAHPMLYGRKAESEVAKELQKYKEQVLALAEAENLISQWSYEIQEKDAAPYSKSKSFPREAAAWVLASLVEVEVEE